MVSRCSVLLVSLWVASGVASAQSFKAAVTPLVEASCLTCHGDRTVTPLNLARLGFDLTDHETYRAWEKVYQRLSKGEMPPATSPQPDTAAVETVLGSLKRALVDANLLARGEHRTPLRRLTRLEYAYTIQDLLGIDEAIASALARTLPAEADSGGFDTVAANQGISPLHVRSYLDAADRALDAAIAVGPPPPVEHFTIEYAKSRRLARNAQGSCLGCGAVKPLDDGYATFHESSSTYLLHSRSEGFVVPYPGRYRVTIDAYAYQANTPVTLTVYLAGGFGALALDNLVGSFDFVGDVPRSVELTPFLRPGDVVSPALADADAPPGVVTSDYFEPRGNFRDYKGEGIALKTMTIDGPLLDSWPPPSTRQLLTGVEFDDDGEDPAHQGALRRMSSTSSRGLRRSRSAARSRRASWRPSRAWPSRCWPTGGRFSRRSACRWARFSAPRRSSSRPVPPAPSTTSRWHRGSPTSCGGACPTPRSSSWRGTIGCPTRRCSPRRSTGCSTTPRRSGSSQISWDKRSGSTS